MLTGRPGSPGNPDCPFIPGSPYKSTRKVRKFKQTLQVQHSLNAGIIPGVLNSHQYPFSSLTVMSVMCNFCSESTIKVIKFKKPHNSDWQNSFYYGWKWIQSPPHSKFHMLKFKEINNISWYHWFQYILNTNFLQCCVCS